MYILSKRFPGYLCYFVSLFQIPFATGLLFSKGPRKKSPEFPLFFPENSGGFSSGFPLIFPGGQAILVLYFVWTRLAAVCGPGAANAGRATNRRRRHRGSQLKRPPLEGLLSLMTIPAPSLFCRAGGGGVTFTRGRRSHRMAAKFVFITGGVVSGLGKGICAASLGRLLKQRGLRVRNQKFDPYINVDPGTMSPYQHGEVFVTDDGAETDLDLGHYERFVDENLTGNCSVSSGQGLLVRAQPGAPGRLSGRHRPDHPPHHRRDQEPDLLHGRRRTWTWCIMRDRRHRGRHRVPALPGGHPSGGRRAGPGNVALPPRAPSSSPIPGSGELKSKPTQHSVKELLRPGHPARRAGVPLRRAPSPRTSAGRSRCSAMWPPECVIQNTTASTLYEVPLLLAKEGLDQVVCRKLGLRCAGQPDLTEWQAMVERDPASPADRDHCPGGQVHPAPRRLSLRGGGPGPRRHRQRRSGGHPVGGLGGAHRRERGPAAGGLQRHPGARRLRPAGHRGHDPRPSAMPGRRPVPYLWHLPGHADGGGGVCPGPCAGLPEDADSAEFSGNTQRPRHRT